MLMLSLVGTNDPILRRPTEEIKPEDIIRYSDFIQTMFSLVQAKNSIGLSAPQVGLNKSLFVISIDGEHKVFINPKIISVSEKKTTESEGCLSLPGLTLKVTRPECTTVTWLNENNVEQVADLEALWARCWLHEYDHLQGIMIDDRVSKLTLDIARRKLSKKAKKAKNKT
jgi:peptide deformylase